MAENLLPDEVADVAGAVFKPPFGQRVKALNVRRRDRDEVLPVLFTHN